MKTIIGGLNKRLKKLSCAIHHQTATMEYTDGELSLLCCCNEFKIICYKEIILALRVLKEKPKAVVMKVVR